jgi:hypothetical protein
MNCACGLVRSMAALWASICDCASCTDAPALSRATMCDELPECR